ncbi:MAG TPA: Fe-S cluster assembly protein SufD [Bryobacteraceae bacterium]|nr:Fe-S cluster assembly protein SufD [Bryobacteraceae bacterium]
MTAVAEQAGAWLAEFSAQAKQEKWIQALREAAFDRFSKLGFPTTRDEEWRFTNVAPIARTNWKTQPASGGPIPEAAEQHLGKHAPETAFSALNTAFLDHVHYVEIPRGTVRETPIEITYDAGHAEGAAHHPRTLIVVGAHAQCTVVETYRGQGKYLTNAVTEIVAGEGAVIDHYKVQLESPEAYHVAMLQASLGRNANFSSHSISLGAALARNDAGAILSVGTEATLNGLYIVNGSQHIDNHTVLDHAKPNGASHEVYKGILDGKSSAVFNGRIIVRQDAQKTDSKQTNKNLVLSDNATINTKPELQIHADDVRCTHGATIGQLDSESMFYLRSRGIPKREARSLLIYAFAQDIVDRIKVPSLRESLERQLFEKFHEHGN